MRYLLAIHFPLLCAIVCAIIGLYPVSAIYLWDMYKRTREYIRIQRCVANTHLFNLYKGSYCQRCVVVARFPEARSYYKMLGYRCYHLIPDAWYDNPLSIRWWRKFVGI